MRITKSDCHALITSPKFSYILTPLRTVKTLDEITNHVYRIASANVQENASLSAEWQFTIAAERYLLANISCHNVFDALYFHSDTPPELLEHAIYHFIRGYLLRSRFSKNRNEQYNWTGNACEALLKYNELDDLVSDCYNVITIARQNYPPRYPGRLFELICMQTLAKQSKKPPPPKPTGNDELAALLTEDALSKLNGTTSDFDHYFDGIRKLLKELLEKLSPVNRYLVLHRLADKELGEITQENGEIPEAVYFIQKKLALTSLDIAVPDGMDSIKLSKRESYCWRQIRDAFRRNGYPVPESTHGNKGRKRK